MVILSGHVTRGGSQVVKCDVWEGKYHIWIGKPDGSGNPTAGASLSIDPDSIPNEEVRRALEVLCGAP